MSLSDDISVLIEETQIDAQATKRRVSPWVVLGVIVAVLTVITVVLGTRPKKPKNRPLRYDDSPPAGTPPEEPLPDEPPADEPSDEAPSGDGSPADDVPNPDAPPYVGDYPPPEYS